MAYQSRASIGTFFLPKLKSKKKHMNEIDYMIVVKKLYGEKFKKFFITLMILSLQKLHHLNLDGVQ